MAKRKINTLVDDATTAPTAGSSTKSKSRSKVLAAIDSAAVSSNPKPAKRQRKKKDPDAPEPEKRGAKFKNACPQNILERVDRVMSQRFFCIDRHREDGALKEEFSVLGSTGNVYTVNIDKKPSCTCPDSAVRGSHCKHILFIYFKVLQVPRESPYWYQKALLTEELEEIFRAAPLAPNAMAHQHVRDAYLKATGNAVLVVEPGANDKRRIPQDGDDCPICYEGMHGVNISTLTFCNTCGNAIHKQCFQQWAKSSPNVTCVFCRAKWVEVGSSSTAAGSSKSGGYINLSSVAGLSPVRDTSSYYRGPRKGNHYGYRNDQDGDPYA